MDESQTFVEYVMLSEAHFWKKVKCAWHNLFMSAYFGDVKYKKDIGVLFIKNYSAVFKSFLEDSKVREFSYCIISLTVQLFTVPSISTLLMTDHSALVIIFQQFFEIYTRFVKQVSGKSKFQSLKSNDIMSKPRPRVNHLLMDTKYILSNIPDTITAATEDAFLKFLQQFVMFISYMQEMNPHVRESSNHILNEKEWDQYFILEINDIQQLMSTVARWCTASPRLFVKSLEILLKAQLDNSDKFEVSKPAAVTSHTSLDYMIRALGGAPNTKTWEKEHCRMKREKLFERQVTYVEHDMFRDPVSFHIPVTRLFAIVFSFFPKFDLPIDLLLKTFTPEELLDIPLRSVLLSQQIEASMWKRNGTTMEQQSSCYRDHYKYVMWDKDLLAVQLLLAVSSPEDALLKLIQKYKIEPYFVLLKSETVSYDPLIRMAEAFSSLLLYVLAERFRLNVSEASETDIIRKDAVHILAISNVLRSKVIKTLEHNYDHFEEGILSSVEVDDILDEISTKIPIEDGVKSMLKLKTECFNEFIPFYYHYSHGQRQSAENTYYQQNNQEFRPPPLPRFTKLTKNLRSYFLSPVMQRFIYVVLKRFTASETPVMVTDLLLHQVLYLVMFAIQDEITTPDDPLPVKFTSVIARKDNPEYLIVEDDKCSILSLLKKLLTLEVKSVNEVKPLIRWILKSYDSLTNNSTDMELNEEVAVAPSVKAADSRKEKMRRHREAILNNFKTQQNKFRLENAEVFDKIQNDEHAKVEDDEMENLGDINHVACGPNKGPIPKPESLILTCILCKDSEKVNSGYSTMMYGCLIEKSVVLNVDKDNEISDEYRLSHLLGGENLHIQSCGHPVHLKCLQSSMRLSPALQHILTMTGADRNRQELFIHDRNSSFLPKGDFSCPYCKMAANCALPVVGYSPHAAPDVTTEEFLEDVACSLDSNNDIEMMELEFAESPTDSSPPQQIVAGFDELTEAANFIEILRDSVRNPSLRLESAVTPPDSDETDQVDPAAKFKEDMRRFCRRAKSISDHEAIGARCYAPFTLKMVSYSFSMLEYVLRDKPLLAGLAEYQEGFFESFLRTLHKSITACDHVYNQEISRELLYMFSPQLSSSVDIPSILNTNTFTIFVAARFVVHRDGKSYDNSLVELCVIAEIIKILLSVTADELSGMDGGAEDACAIQLASLWGHVRKLCGFSGSDDLFQCPTYLVSKVKQNLLPLLRKLALFLRYATSIPFSVAFKEMQSPAGEFSLLLKYLNIESLSTLLEIEGGSKMKLIHKWCQSIDRIKFELLVKFNRNKREAKLIPLPESYIDLIVKASQYTCPRIQFGKIQTTAMCLVCGEMLCFQSYCCQETIGDSNFGPCNVHAHRCSGDLGIFLTLEKCQVLLLPLRTQGYFINGPYVDKYGESYKSTKNKALTLSPQIYKKIENMWVRHEIRPMVDRNKEGGGFSRNEQIAFMY